MEFDTYDIANVSAVSISL